ncbi:MAG TPA: hypothetical protein VGL98_15805 [Gammaproteobacteria bacterium]
MKTRTIVVLIVAAAAAIAAIGLSQRSVRVSGTEQRAADSAASAPRDSASTSLGPDSTTAGQTGPAPRTTDTAWRTPSSPSPRYAEPEEIERQLEQFFAAQRGLEVVSLSSIDCGATACEITLTGTEVNPRYVGAYSELHHKLLTGPWKDFLILSGGISTREIAPGAREYVISFAYQPLVDLSADPLIAARQYAACAAFWQHMTENPAPDDIARGYLDRAEHYEAVAATVLGEQAAALVAAETRGGPVLRDCAAPPN